MITVTGVAGGTGLLRAMRFPHDPTFTVANLVESLLWMMMGVVVWRRVGGGGRWVGGLALALVAFGVSDIAEAYTGAWRRPAWLFCWKAVCVLAILGLSAGIYFQRRPDRPR